jgi:hypothetical protein
MLVRLHPVCSFAAFINRPLLQNLISFTSSRVILVLGAAQQLVSVVPSFA